MAVLGKQSALTPMIGLAIKRSILKLDPREQIRNFVMFIVFLGALITTAVTFGDPSAFNIQTCFWLWFTVLFSNFAEALAEGRGKAQADSLKKARTHTIAKLLNSESKVSEIESDKLKPGDFVLCDPGDIIPGDGEVVEGIASVDESAITGESAPVIRESGGDRSAVTGGTKVLSDHIKIRITSRPGDSFLDRMISLIEGAKRQMTPNEKALRILLVALTTVFMVSVISLKAFTLYAERESVGVLEGTTSVVVLISLLVCLIPTTIGGLLSAIGISGIDQMIRKNVLAMSGRAVEAAGDVDVLLLDKTGTITLGNRMATDFISSEGVTPEELADAAQLASLADETPEGRSIVILAKDKFKIRARNIAELKASFIPFSAQTRMSGVDLEVEGGVIRRIRKGAFDAIEAELKANGAHIGAAVREAVESVAKRGGTPLVVVDGVKVLGVIHLKDIVKGGIRDRFAQLRQLGIRTVMITGDNPLTAAAIAAEAGVDDFIAEATPQAKLKRIREEQTEGHLVAMIGDGTNDAPALAQADVGIAMNTGTQAAREAGNMVDLDSNPTKLLEVVEIGKRILMTRGALTTFSVANDVAKYFAILPAIFLGVYARPGEVVGPLAQLNFMGLATPESAILSSVIFNAIIIVFLIPLALRGVRWRSVSPVGVLRRNLLVFGLGGLVLPFIGIKLIDMALMSWGWL